MWFKTSISAIGRKKKDLMELLTIKDVSVNVQSMAADIFLLNAFPTFTK